MAKIEPLKIRSVIIAQDIRQEISGQQTLVGVFVGDIGVANPPLMVPQLVIRIEFEAREAFEAPFSFSIISPSKTKILTQSSNLVAKKGLNIFCVTWTPVFLYEPGQYQIRFGVGEERVIDRFEVRFGSVRPRVVGPGVAPPAETSENVG
jgi:hypothetical protein